MSWERKALERIILLLAEKDKEFGKLASTLSELGIELNFDGACYKILREITGWELLPENMEAMEEGRMSKEDFVRFCLEYIEEKFS
jgi:hypothetical protein